jgi:hypothetical protein
MRKTKLKKWVKRLVWILMLALFVFNSATSELTGLAQHIASGLAFMVLAIVHICLNGRYFIHCLANFPRRTMAAKARVSLIIDLLMIVAFLLLLVFGFILAADYLPSEFAERHDLELTHGLVAAVGFFLVLAHAILHLPRRKKPKRRP